MIEQSDPLAAGGVADVSVRRAPADPTDRTAWLRRGPDVARLDEAETLTLILSRCLAPGADPAAATAALLERFGCIGRVVGASARDLTQIFGADAAAELVLLHALLVQSLEYPLRGRCVLSSSSAVQAYLRARLGACPARPSTCSSSTGPTS